MTAQKSSKTRQAEIIAAGLDLAEKEGYQRITRDKLAAATGLSPGAVSFVGGTMAQIQRLLMRAAVQQKRLRVIAQGLAVGDKNTSRISDELRKAAADSLKE